MSIGILVYLGAIRIAGCSSEGKFHKWLRFEGVRWMEEDLVRLWKSVEKSGRERSSSPPHVERGRDVARAATKNKSLEEFSHSR